MKVFLAEENSRYDLTSLEGYGGVYYISNNGLNPFDSENCMKILNLGLEKFDPTTDYICMTGNLLTVSFLMAIAYSKFQTFRVLAFDARTSNYKERVIVHV